MMNTLQTEFYGDSTRWFMARVIDSTPPYGLEGRVKIRVIGVHSDSVLDIPQVDLPWAQVMIPGTSYGSSGYGQVPQLLPGALVFGVFLDGKQSQLPIVLGSLPKIEYPTSVQADSRDDIATNPFAYDYRQSNYEGVDPGSSNLDAPSSENQRKIVAFRFFLDNGYTLIQSAAIVGVLGAVSGVSPDFDESGFYGIGAWQTSSDRYLRLNRFASSQRPSKTAESFDLQLLFVLNELRTTRSLTNGKLLYADKLGGQKGAVSIFFDYYLDNPTKFLSTDIQGEEQSGRKYNAFVEADSIYQAWVAGSFTL